jgi:hypothetical protein
MPPIRPKGLVALLIGTILGAYLVTYHHPPTREQIKAEPMLIESRTPAYVSIGLLAAAILFTTGIVMILNDFQSHSKTK